MRSRNHCCGGKALGVTYSGSVFVAFGIEHEIAYAPCCALWPDRIKNIFPHYLVNGTIFWEKVIKPLAYRIKSHL
jgi:hypothetical protein